MKNYREMLLLFLTLMLVACQVQPPAASPEDDAKAKSFLPDPDKAALYIWNGAPLGSLATVTINGNPVEKFPHNETYVYLKLMPGKYLVESIELNVDYVPAFVLPISVEANKQYFIFFEKGSFTLAEEDIGRTRVRASKMVPSLTPDAELSPVKSDSTAKVRPLSIGVYYSPEFFKASMQHQRNLGFFRSETYVIPLALPSQWIFDLALEKAFKTVSTLPEWPPSPTSSGIDLFLVPRVANFKSHGAHHNTPSISYLVSIYIPGKGEISTIVLDGFALNNSWSSAIGSAAAQLVTSLEKVPIVASHEPLPEVTLTEKSKGLPSSGLRDNEGFSVVPLLEKPESLTPATKMQKCLESKVVSNQPKLHMVPSFRVRAIGFPWLEAGMVPSQESLENLLGQAPVASQLERLGVRYVLLPTIEHVDNFGGPFMCGGGGPAAGCLGVAAGSQTTRFTVPVWDVAAGAMLDAPIAGETKGFSWIVGYVIPVWHMADTLGEACSEIVESFGRRIQR